MSKIENYVKFLEDNPEIEGLTVREFFLVYILSKYILVRNNYNPMRHGNTTEVLVEEENRNIFIAKCKEILEVESESVS